MYEKNQLGPEDHFWNKSMRTLRAKVKSIEISERLPEIIDEWYREHGLETPPWKLKKPYFDKDGNIIRPE